MLAVRPIKEERRASGWAWAYWPPICMPLCTSEAVNFCHAPPNHFPCFFRRLLLLFANTNDIRLFFFFSCLLRSPFSASLHRLPQRRHFLCKPTQRRQQKTRRNVLIRNSLLYVTSQRLVDTCFVNGRTTFADFAAPLSWVCRPRL